MSAAATVLNQLLRGSTGLFTGAQHGSVAARLAWLLQTVMKAAARIGGRLLLLMAAVATAGGCCDGKGCGCNGEGWVLLLCAITDGSDGALSEDAASSQWWLCRQR